MTTTITDAFHLPRPEDITAMGFVVKLREADAQSDEVKQLAADYVVTPAVEKELPRILDDMKQVFDRGEEYGRFIHGSFGSGKSHFMTMLSLLIEGAEPAWSKLRPLFAGKDHEAWLQRAGLLVVRIHMLSVRGRSTSLDRAVYEGFNAALARRGKAPFEFLHVGGIFEEVRREAKEYGDVVWKRLEAEGIVGGREDFEAIANGRAKARERFARAWLAYKGRDAADAGIDPRWSEGLSRMAEHAKAQGFGGVVLMIDEFLLWLPEKSGQEFVQEINNLNVIVDHNTGQRPAPVFVFVARQRNLQEFFPDLVDESKIHEHLDHHTKRFEVTKLQDVELRRPDRARKEEPRFRREPQQGGARRADARGLRCRGLHPSQLGEPRGPRDRGGAVRAGPEHRHRLHLDDGARHRRRRPRPGDPGRRAEQRRVLPAEAGSDGATGRGASELRVLLPDARVADAGGRDRAARRAGLGRGREAGVAGHARPRASSDGARAAGGRHLAAPHPPVDRARLSLRERARREAPRAHRHPARARDPLRGRRRALARPARRAALRAAQLLRALRSVHRAARHAGPARQDGGRLRPRALRHHARPEQGAALLPARGARVGGRAHRLEQGRAPRAARRAGARPELARRAQHALDAALPEHDGGAPRGRRRVEVAHEDGGGRARGPARVVRRRARAGERAARGPG